MRDLDDRHKLSVRGIQEAAQALEDLVALVKHRVRWRTHEVEPSKPGKAAIVNALLLWMSAQPELERIRIVREGLKSLDDLLALEEPDGVPRPDPGDVESRDVGGPPPARGRKGRSA